MTFVRKLTILGHKTSFCYKLPGILKRATRKLNDPAWDMTVCQVDVVVEKA